MNDLAIAALPQPQVRLIRVALGKAAVETKPKGWGSAEKTSSIVVRVTPVLTCMTKKKVLNIFGLANKD